MSELVMKGIELGISLGVAVFVGVVVFATLVILLSRLLGPRKRRKRDEEVTFDDSNYDDDLK